MPARTDERVQLERLRGELLGPGGQPRQRRALALSPPHLLALTHAEGQLLDSYQDKVRAWGWEWQQPSCAGSERLLTHVPLVLGTALTATDMKVRCDRSIVCSCFIACLQQMVDEQVPFCAIHAD